MNPNSDLFQAILAMDAYNRVGGNVTSRNLAVADTGSIGNVEISVTGGDNASGFFAQSYVVQGTGQKIISFRGTDFVPTPERSKDILYGWSVGAGLYTENQAQLAAQFFQQVVANGNPNATLADLYNANVLMTGHSLGGGLAGFLATIYKSQSNTRIFDPMAFALAAERALVGAQDVQLYDSEGHPTGMGADAETQQIRDIFFRGEKPTAIGSSGIGSYSIVDQILSPSTLVGFVPGASSSLLLTPEYDLGFTRILDGSQRHSQSLLVIRMYADVAGISTDWLAASKYVLTRLFDDSLAQALGLVNAGATGASSASDKLRAMIAYSAIDDGVRPYGDTGIRALFDDTGDFGTALTGSNVSTTLTASADPIGQIVAQYAGQLALDAILKDGHPEELAGILTLANDQLVVDLNKNRWTSESANPNAKIVGRDDLLKNIRSAGGLSEDDFKNALSRIWDDPEGKRIDRIVVQTKEEAFSGSVPARPTGSDENGVTLFITSGQDDTITGTAADEAIYGGDGRDIISGGDGKDLLLGGGDEDTLDGGAGDDLLIGGAKSDILKGGAGKDELWGGDDADQLWGGADNDIIRGGAGSDTIYADAGNDSIFGDDQTDTYRFKGDDAVTGGANPWDASGVSLTLGNVAATSSTGQSVTDTTLIGSATGADVLESVEIVQLTDRNDTVLVQSGYDKITDKILIDGLGQAPGTKDVLDFSQLNTPLSLTDAKLDGAGLTFTNFEKLVLTNKADTLKITSLSKLGGLNEIDAGANPAGTYDTVDLSQSTGAIKFSNGTLTGNNQKILLKNFEKILGSSAKDSLDLTKSSVIWADGAAGNDILTGGAAASTLIGGDGTDQLFAGSGGDTLEGGVSNGTGDSYVGGRGADTFIIGNGTHAKQGIDAKFNISNAGSNDRLVLRLSDTAGANAASAFTKGIVLSGGIQSLIWLNDGRVQTPHVPDPNHVYAVFSSVLVKPTGVTAESNNGRSSATVDGKILEDARSELGDFVVNYDWNKSASTLDIKITTAYGDFAVHIDNYSAGQLGLTFIDKNEPIDGFTVFGDNAGALLQGSWNGYNDAMRSLVQGAQLVDVPSPGNAAAGDADPVTPTIPKNGYLADFASFFNPEAGSRFGGSGTSNPNDPNNASNPKRAPFLDSHKNPLKRDPLILDLSGNGLHLTAESLSDTYVDFNGTGFANRTGWVDAEAGILINYTGSTAIGPNTILGATSGDGFGDLAALDSNSDGQVDASDSAAASLRVWVDQDGDGRIGADEVFTLADAGVSSIGLQVTASGELMNGNTIAATASFVRTDATTGDLFEVNFATDPVLTQAIIPDGFEYSPVALGLPGLDGYGHVADLRYDMTVDSSLQNEALQLVLNSGGMTGSQFDAAFEHLVQSWAGSAAVDPSSRGPLIDARHMAVVEAFYGQTFAEVNGAGAVLDAIDAANIEQAYGSILDAMKIRFAAQIKDAAIANGETAAEAAANPLAAFATLDYTVATDLVSLNLAQLAASIANAIPSDPAKREAYVDLIARAARALRIDFYAEDSARLAAGFDAAVATAGLALGSRLQLAAEITASSIIDATGQGSTVTGTSSNEVILAGAGDQTLAGGGGADVYIYSAAADGNDTIQAGGSQSVLILTDLVQSGVTFSRSRPTVPQWHRQVSAKGFRRAIRRCRKRLPRMSAGSGRSGAGPRTTSRPKPRRSRRRSA
jgi:Ca2+-binding RTX toxin-like protein